MGIGRPAVSVGIGDSERAAWLRLFGAGCGSGMPWAAASRGGAMSRTPSNAARRPPKRNDWTCFANLCPSARVFAALVNPENFESAPGMKEVGDGALKLGLELHVFNARSEEEIDAAFAGMAKLRTEALFVQAD
jgi:hypothetical protein